MEFFLFLSKLQLHSTIIDQFPFNFNNTHAIQEHQPWTPCDLETQISTYGSEHYIRLGQPHDPSNKFRCGFIQEDETNRMLYNNHSGISGLYNELVRGTVDSMLLARADGSLGISMTCRQSKELGFG